MLLLYSTFQTWYWYLVLVSIVRYAMAALSILNTNRHERAVLPASLQFDKLRVQKSRRSPFLEVARTIGEWAQDLARVWLLYPSASANTFAEIRTAALFAILHVFTLSLEYERCGNTNLDDSVDPNQEYWMRRKCLVERSVVDASM